MKITELLAQHIIEVHKGGNWTEVDIAATLKDVSMKEATTLTQASPNTIAAIIHHLTFWNRVMIQRSQHIAVRVDETNGFNVPALPAEEAWQQLQADNIQSAHELADAVTHFDETKLFEPVAPNHSSAYKNFQGTIEHIHYHLGQIVILKRLIKAMNK